jgi:thiol-disulfide isomerase/thioredoxin
VLRVSFLFALLITATRLHAAESPDAVGMGDCGVEARKAWSAEFEAAHPAVDVKDPAGFVARERAYLQESENWIAACPQEPAFRARRLRAMNAVPDLPSSAVLQEVREFLRLCKGQRSVACIPPQPKLKAVELLARHGSVQEAEALLGRVRAQVHESETACTPQLDYACWQLARAEVRIALARRDLQHARSTIEGEERRIAEPLSGNAREMATQEASRATERADLVGLRGELAEAAGQRLDAALLFRKADWMGDFDAARRFQARKLWTELGGTDESWNARESVERPVRASGWARADEPFKLDGVVDLNGRSWSAADIQGKTVLVNFWATWCAPCLAELPFVQRVQENVRSTSTLLVLTISLDEDVATLRRFVAQRPMELPVILGFDAFREQLDQALPMTLIVDPRGRVVRRSAAYLTDGSVDWTGETIAEMQAVAAGAAERPRSDR